jgi:hypothetical protein
MSDCARCGVSIPNHSEGSSNYCGACQSRFDKVRQEGVIVEKQSGSSVYQIAITTDETRQEWGTESTQIEALARGQYLCERLGVEGLFHYHGSGSQWLLDEYLRANPQIRQDVQAEADHLTDQGEGGILDDIQTVI